MERYLVKSSGRGGAGSTEHEEVIAETGEQRKARQEREEKMEYTNKTIFRNECFRPHQKVSTRKCAAGDHVFVPANHCLVYSTSVFVANY